MPLSFKEVAEIMKMIDASSCDDFVLEAEGMRLAIRRSGASGNAEHSSAATMGQPAKAAMPAAPAAPKPAAGAKPSPQSDVSGTFTEKSPMVGTFYRRPSQEEPPFVEVGAKVFPGDPLCMIEVMKLYTTISCSVEGVVDAILADDATLVEFDQPLFNIRPA